MLRRRAVIARWEPRRGHATIDLAAAVQPKMAELASDPLALIYAETLALTIDKLTSTEMHARFMTLRGKDNSPIQYDPSSGLTPIAVPPGCFIADAMHAIFTMAPDHEGGFLCFDRHDDGPTLGELTEYFNDFLRISISFVSLYKQDLKRELEDMAGQFRRIEIGFVPSQVPNADRLGYFGSLTNLHLGPKVNTIGFSISTGRARDSYLPEDLQEAAMSLTANAGDILDRLKIKGRRRSDGKIEELNILRSRIGAHIDLVASSGADNMPDPEDAYLKLSALFNKYERDGVLAQALSARALVSQ